MSFFNLKKGQLKKLMNVTQLFAVPLYKYMEMSSSPNATTAPEAAKSNRFTTGQISIFFIIALLIIAGVISIIYCFYFQKKNAKKLSIDIHDPFRTKKIVDSHRYNINSYDQEDDNSLTSLQEISDIEDKDEIKEQDNDNQHDENATSNANNDCINTNNNFNSNKNLKEEIIIRHPIQRAISLPTSSRKETLTQKSNINAVDDSYYSINSKSKENLMKSDEV